MSWSLGGCPRGESSERGNVHPTTSDLTLGGWPRMRRVVGLAGTFTALGACLLVLTSCGSSSSSPRVAKSKLTIWYSTDDPVETNWAKGLVPIFEKAHPNIQVNMHVFDLDDFNDKMQDALGSNTGPDLAYATPRAPAIPIYVTHGELTNLTSYALKYDWSGLLRPGLLDFWNGPFRIWNNKAPDFNGGDDDDAPPTTSTQIYGVPDAMAAVAVAYNTKLMAKLNITFPKTVSQMVADAVLAKKAGMIPFGIGNNDLWLGDDWYISLAEQSYSVSRLEPVLSDGYFNFASHPFLKAGNLLSQWSKDGYFTPSYSALDAQGGVISFFRGKTLFQLLSSSENAQLLQSESSTKVPIAVAAFPGSFPGHTGLMPYSGYEGWIVPKASHDKAGAVTWINFMLHPSATKYLLAHGVLPTTRVTAMQAPTAFQREFLTAFAGARRGIYLDATPVPNFDANMEGNIANLLAGRETSRQLATANEQAYQSFGKTANHVMDIDGEY